MKKIDFQKFMPVSANKNIMKNQINFQKLKRSIIPVSRNLCLFDKNINYEEPD